MKTGNIAYGVLFLFVIFAAGSLAGDFMKSWPPGRQEILEYEIATFMPQETKNPLTVKISRPEKEDSLFVIEQTMEIPRQELKIFSSEKYGGQPLQLISSQNVFHIPEKGQTELNVDSVVVNAVPKDDSLSITSNSYIAASGNFTFYPDLVTTVGSLFMTRTGKFEIGQTNSYHYINLLQLGREAVSYTHLTLPTN